MTIDRRTFLKGAAAAGGLLAAGVSRPTKALFSAILPTELVPSATPITNVVVLMMENRSADHYLGWYGAELAGKVEPTPEAKNPGKARKSPPPPAPLAFDGTQARSYPDDDGVLVPTSAWAPDYTGCNFNDPNHGWGSGRGQLVNFSGNGEPEGFMAGPGVSSDEFATAYYQPDDIPVTARLVREFTTFDRYFCSVLGPTYPNREYMHSGQSGGLTKNDFPPQVGYNTGFPWPTIWDTLDARGVSWAYYFSNLPVIGLWGAKHAHGARHISSFYADCAAGRLPQVVFLDPYFVQGSLANDDHPHADIRLGQQFISDVVQAFMSSVHWRSGAFFLNYDEWGGFWDHVMPGTVADPRASEGFDQLGFRTPTVLASPYAAGGRVDHGLYDHTSILEFIRLNWALPELGSADFPARSAAGRSIGAAFDFVSPPRLEVDTATYKYTADPEAYVPCELKGHTPPLSDLTQLAENGWLEAQGYRIDWRFEDSFASRLPIH